MLLSRNENLNNAEWLESELKNNRPAQIARNLGVERGSVTRAIKRFNLTGYVKRSRVPELDNKDWLELELQTKSFRLIAKEINTSIGNVADRAYRYGIKSPSTNKSESIKAAIKKRYPNGRFGANSSHWKNGKAITGSGHIQIYSPEHPNKDKRSYMMEHRLVMEKKLGRYLTSKEIVHHIDLDKTNNDPTNLDVLANDTAHRNTHHSLELAGAMILKSKKPGIIVYEDNLYHAELDF